jgi:hypothetical protein
MQILHESLVFLLAMLPISWTTRTIGEVKA